MHYRPTIPLNDPPDAPKYSAIHLISNDTKSSQRNFSGEFCPFLKRFLMGIKRPGNGLAKNRSIRSEINSFPKPIGHNYLNINDIFTLIECTY